MVSQKNKKEGTSMEKKLDALNKIKEAIPRISKNVWVNGDFGDIRTDANLTNFEQEIIYGLPFVKSVSRNDAAGTWCITV